MADPVLQLAGLKSFSEYPGSGLQNMNTPDLLITPECTYLLGFRNNFVFY